MPFPTKKIAELIKEEKWAEFRDELKKWLASEEGKKSSGEELLNAVHAYAKVSNEFMEKYLEELKEIEGASKLINKTKKSVDDIDRSSRIKDKIKDL